MGQLWFGSNLNNNKNNEGGVLMIFQIKIHIVTNCSNTHGKKWDVTFVKNMVWILYSIIQIQIQIQMDNQKKEYFISFLHLMSQDQWTKIINGHNL